MNEWIQRTERIIKHGDALHLCAPSVRALAEGVYNVRAGKSATPKVPDGDEVQGVTAEGFDEARQARILDQAGACPRSSLLSASGRRISTTLALGADRMGSSADRHGVPWSATLTSFDADGNAVEVRRQVTINDLRPSQLVHSSSTRESLGSIVAAAWGGCAPVNHRLNWSSSQNGKKRGAGGATR